MNEEEKNVYKCLFEYPTKKIASLEIENLKLEKELDQYKNNWEELKKEMNRDDLSYIETQFVLDKMEELEEKLNEK